MLMKTHCCRKGHYVGRCVAYPEHFRNSNRMHSEGAPPPPALPGLRHYVDYWAGVCMIQTFSFIHLLIYYRFRVEDKQMQYMTRKGMWVELIFSSTEEADHGVLPQ